MFPNLLTTDWPIYAGDTASLVIQFVDDEGVGVDIGTEYEDFRAQWRRSPSDYQAVEIAVDTSEASTGTIRLDLTPEQTRGMKGPGVFDLQATLEGDPHTFFSGRTAWKDDVTK